MDIPASLIPLFSSGEAGGVVRISIFHTFFPQYAIDTEQHTCSKGKYTEAVLDFISNPKQIFVENTVENLIEKDSGLSKLKP